jgi:outer membrane protein assembly factor BamB
MKSRSLTFFCFFLIVFLSVSQNISSQNNNWTFFRGSNLNGIAETDSIPLNWDASNTRWKTEIHDRGLSSPVVYDNQIWLTTATSDGRELFAVAVDYNSGQIIYDIKVFTPATVESKNSMNSYATPTPCIEKGFVYVHYGNSGTACIRTSDGSIVWKNTDYKCRYVQGAAASPVLYKNLVILHFEGTDTRFIVALNKSDGKLVWRKDRPAEPYFRLTEIGRKAYITPLLINVKGRDLLISNGSAVCQALDPDTGEEIWRVVHGAESTISMPFTEKGVVYWYTGYMVADDGSKFTDLLAVNPDGKGDITGTNILWKKRDELSQNQMLTPVIKDGLIYSVTTRNNLMCIDAASGKEVWATHLMTAFNASLVYLNGIVWLFSVKGEAMAIKAGQKYEVLARNQMDSGIWATPAFLRNSVVLRTEKYLYRIGH